MVNIPKGGKSEFIVVFLIREGDNQWASGSRVKHPREDLQDIVIMKLGISISEGDLRNNFG